VIVCGLFVVWKDAIASKLGSHRKGGVIRLVLSPEADKFEILKAAFD